jgi:hypothetical protein
MFAYPRPGLLVALRPRLTDGVEGNAKLVELRSVVRTGSLEGGGLSLDTKVAACAFKDGTYVDIWLFSEPSKLPLPLNAFRLGAHMEWITDSSRESISSSMSVVLSIVRNDDATGELQPSVTVEGRRLFGRKDVLLRTGVSKPERL